MLGFFVGLGIGVIIGFAGLGILSANQYYKGYSDAKSRYER